MFKQYHHIQQELPLLETYCVLGSMLIITYTLFCLIPFYKIGIQFLVTLFKTWKPNKAYRLISSMLQ